MVCKDSRTGLGGTPKPPALGVFGTFAKSCQKIGGLKAALYGKWRSAEAGANIAVRRGGMRRDHGRIVFKM